MNNNKITRICGNKPAPNPAAICAITRQQEDALIKLIGRQRIDTGLAIGLTSNDLSTLDQLYRHLICRRRLCARSSAN